MKISLDRTVRALSSALDLAGVSSIENSSVIEKISNVNYSEHRFLNHSKETAYIALELGNCLHFSDEQLKALYISSLLHDTGATDNFAYSHSSDNFIREHCLIGANTLESFPIYSNINNIIKYHHENWDGSGPMKMQFDSIPIESQIIRLSDVVDVIYNRKIPSYKQRTNITKWLIQQTNVLFSKKLIDAFLAVSSTDAFWFNLESLSVDGFPLDNIAPKTNIYLNLQQFGSIANIFSKVIDNKSKFTARHSIGISELAYNVSKHIGYDEEKCEKMKIAGLLHDIGKLAIPNTILDKNGPLTKDEFSIIKSHVYYTKMILDRIGDIPDISNWAGNHHEKLNGKGYPRLLKAPDLSEECRIMCICDIYQALTEDRPYRKGLSSEKAFSILDSMALDNFVCGNAVQYLKDTIKYK